MFKLRKPSNMQFNYQKICYTNLLGDLPDRQKEVIIRRFGLRGKRETLESIGMDLGTTELTRERVRQIEKVAMERLREKGKTLSANVFQQFSATLRKNGGLKKEGLLLEMLGGNKFKNHIFFLLTLANGFERVLESDTFCTLWTNDKNSLPKAQKAINNFVCQLKKKNQLQVRPAYVLPSYLEVSKIVLPSSNGLYGLKGWPEINPRGVKDRAYFILKQNKKPLHFTEVTSLVKWNCSGTVHNELIKDSRFVLVGKGTYALQEWGYTPGTVKEVIINTIQKFNKPLSKEKILKDVLKQRYVKASTVLLNLQNKKYFVKKPKGYTVKPRYS